MTIVNAGGRNAEKIIGRIAYFTFNRTGIPSKYFWLERPNGNGCFCKGLEIRGREISEDCYLELTGEWKVNQNPKYTHLGKQFYFSSYKHISSLDSATSSSDESHVDTVKMGTAGAPASVAKYLAIIGQHKISYEFHNPPYNSIACHVKTQLNERIINASREEKDFYFLTALLDRNVRDSKIQDFRNRRPNFKRELIQCWEEAQNDLAAATDSISEAIRDDKLTDSIIRKSTSFQSLLKSIPGRSKMNQLLLCLKIVKDKYRMGANTTIIDLIPDFRAEMLSRDYLLSLHGIGQKLANWSLTNITGHWFVVDLHIERLIRADLGPTLATGPSVSSTTAGAIFRHWFGMLDEGKKCYTKFSQKQFKDTFPAFDERCCEYLPFIVTQYLWFYGKFYGD